jgi:uncharacterized protein (DUF697 family)
MDLTKLTSRKFLLPVVTAITIALNDVYGWGLEQETVNAMVAAVASFVLGEAAVDRAWIKANADKYISVLAAEMERARIKNSGTQA